MMGKGVIKRLIMMNFHYINEKKPISYCDFSLFAKKYPIQKISNKNVSHNPYSGGLQIIYGSSMIPM